MKFKLRKRQHAEPKQPLKAERWDSVSVPRTTQLQRRLVLTHIESEGTDDRLPVLIDY